MIATGSRPNRPDDVPFDSETVFDSETILQLPRMPRTMTVLGAGVVGIEYASIFAALGISVTLVDSVTFAFTVTAESTSRNLPPSAVAPDRTRAP